MVLLAPSILSADFARLGDEVKAIAGAGADFIHVDVMDGFFVPNITIGPPVLKALRPLTDLPFDVHLMIREPEKYLTAFRDAGADILTVHAEACPHLHRTMESIKDLGLKAGVSVNPATPVDTLRHVLKMADLVLVMSVNPGFGGQKFIPGSLEKIAELAGLRKTLSTEFLIEVDGGINPDTASQCAKAGADVLVAGNFVFAEPPYAERMKDLRKAVKKPAKKANAKTAPQKG